MDPVHLTHLVPEPPRAKGTAPTVYCYICGRQFGSKSIDIHQPQCLKKWHLQNDKLPKSQRRAAPVKPEIIRTHGGKIDLEATNIAMYEAAQAQLVKCAYCGRSFAPDRLAVHNRSCTRENPAKPVGGRGAMQQKN
jgi:endogenous inhibitor of DNA gyrase (YacG/DUF329 family)